MHFYELPLLFALIGLALYTVLAGADFGAGFWQLAAGRGPRGERLRDQKVPTHHQVPDRLLRVRLQHFDHFSGLEIHDGDHAAPRSRLTDRDEVGFAQPTVQRDCRQRGISDAFHGQRTSVRVGWIGF